MDKHSFPHARIYTHKHICLHSSTYWKAVYGIKGSNHSSKEERLEDQSNKSTNWTQIYVYMQDINYTERAIIDGIIFKMNEKFIKKSVKSNDIL